MECQGPRRTPGSHAARPCGRRSRASGVAVDQALLPARSLLPRDQAPAPHGLTPSRHVPAPDVLLRIGSGLSALGSLPARPHCFDCVRVGIYATFCVLGVADLQRDQPGGLWRRFSYSRLNGNTDPRQHCYCCSGAYAHAQSRTHANAYPGADACPHARQG